MNYFTVNLPLNFSEIFNIFRITVFSSLVRIRECFREGLKMSKPVDERSNSFQETIVYGCLHYGIKQNSFTLLVCDLEN